MNESSQLDKQPDAVKEIESRNLLVAAIDFMKNEVALIAMLTALLYYYSYLTDKAYLQYFYICEEFVSFSIERLVISAAMFGALALVIYQILDFVVMLKWSRSAIAIVLAGVIPGFFLFIAISIYSQVGWTAATWIFSGVAAVFLCWSYILPYFQRKKYGSYLDAIIADLHFEATRAGPNCLNSFPGFLSEVSAFG